MLWLCMVVDLALRNPVKATEIYQKMLEAEKHWFGAPDPWVCTVAKDMGVWPPFSP